MTTLSVSELILTMINFCLSFWSFRNSSTVRLSTVFFSKIKSQVGECVLCSFLIMQENHSASGTKYIITRELMTFNKSNNPDFKSESYSIKLHTQSLSQLSNAIVESSADTDSLRVVLRLPSFQLFQTEETLRCVWTILPRGVNKSSFGHL